MIKKDNTIFSGIFSLMVSYCVMPFVKHVCPDAWIYWMILVALIGLAGGAFIYRITKKMIQGITVDGENASKQRTVGLDIVRVLACVLVITAHYIISLGYYGIEADNSFYYLGLSFVRWFSQCCCPLFMVLSGFFLLNRKVDKKHYWGIMLLLRDYIVLCVIYLMFLGKESITLDLIKSLVNFNQYWYINMYFGLFLLVPFLNILWHRLNREERKVLILVLIVLSSLATLTDSWVTNYWFGLYPIMYYYIGAWLREYPVKINKLFGVISLIGIMLLQSVYTAYAGWGNVFDWVVNFGGYSCAYNALPTMICSVLLILLLKDIKVKNRYLARGLMIISKNSLIIYLAAVMFLGTITDTKILPYLHIQNKFILFVIKVILDMGIATILGCIMSWVFEMISKIYEKIRNKKEITMQKLRLFFILAAGILLLIVAACGVWAIKARDSQVKDFQFTSYSHKDVNDFETISVSESETITQPIISQGNTLNSLLFFVQYSEKPIVKTGKIVINITDKQGNLVADTYLDCLGVPDEGWFAWLYDFNVSLLPDELYYINFTPTEVGENTLEFRVADSNLGVASHYPDLVYEGSVQSDTVLIITEVFTGTMTGVIPRHCENMLELLGICFVLCIAIILILSIIILVNRQKKVIESVPVPHSIIIVLVVLLLGGYIYQQIQPWYEEEPIIAHALGSIDDKTYTNSKDAFEQSVDLGYRYLEAAFSTTSDGHIVLRHDWENKDCPMGFSSGYVPTLEEFRSHTIWDTYVSLSLLDLFILMDENPDVYIITDSKEGAYDVVVEQFTTMVETAKENGYEHVLKRFIVQIYNDDMLQAVESVYSFDNYIYTLYQRGYTDIEQLIDFCRRNEIDVITVFDLWWYEQPEFKQAIQDSGLVIYLHTVNDLGEAVKFKQEGVANVYTDFILPKDL